ncbi:hypothetical protein [Curtobacterium flaccumfaciens]|jgi:hypothetical protein|uniref:hypothetical protein n=1 Tax=Curtobacterium flaccumfaciens TaxID=2035 RepID=UPI003CF03D4D
MLSQDVVQTLTACLTTLITVERWVAAQVKETPGGRWLQRGLGKFTWLLLLAVTALIAVLSVVGNPMLPAGVIAVGYTMLVVLALRDPSVLDGAIAARRRAARVLRSRPGRHVAGRG